MMAGRGNQLGFSDVPVHMMAHEWQHSMENIDDDRLHDGDAAVLVVLLLMMAYGNGNGDGGSSDGNGQSMMAHLCGSRNSSSGKSNSRQKAAIVCMLEDRVQSVSFSLHFAATSCFICFPHSLL